ncbi:MAG: DmsE family decaheme c-type cytochrome [Gammaproteobacteria bacterium]|jgi:DmsE family decaheme c-type cytochrome
MNHSNCFPFAHFLLWCCVLCAGTLRAEQAATEQGKSYTDRGADTCIKCHDEDSEYPVFDIFKTKHGQRGDPRAPFAGLQCEACHGPGDEHAGRVRRGHERPPILNFGDESDAPVEEQNHMCLNCHQTDSHIAWKGSRHESGNLSCAHCHVIHAAEDPVLTRMDQAEVCYKCHKKERAEFYKPSHHPVRFGQVTCTECHNPHGAITASLLVRPTLNQTCYTCHAEKRGPFLWEHAPVPEDCTLCHNPHGSIHPALLNKTAPLLCQQCHSQAGHPSVAYTGAGLPGGSASGFMLSGACLNCHSQVHGSNHPSGVKLMR